MTLLKLDVVFAGLKSGTKFSIVAVLNEDSISFIYQCLALIFKHLIFKHLISFLNSDDVIMASESHLENRFLDNISLGIG